MSAAIRKISALNVSLPRRARTKNPNGNKISFVRFCANTTFCERKGTEIPFQNITSSEQSTWHVFLGPRMRTMEDEVVLYFRSFDTQSVHLASASLVEHGGDI